ncbi:hypothetical protein [Thiobacillus sp.]
MPTDNARNQQAFRDRLKQDGGARVELTLNKDLLQAVEQVRQSLGAGYTRQDALTHLLNQGASTVKTNQYREDQTSGQPSRPSQMTVAEHQELEKFKESLPQAALATQQVQQAHAFNGGDDGARRKAAFEAQLNATNQHRK